MQLVRLLTYTGYYHLEKLKYTNFPKKQYQLLSTSVLMKSNKLISLTA